MSDERGKNVQSTWKIWASFWMDGKIASMMSPVGLWTAILNGVEVNFHSGQTVVLHRHVMPLGPKIHFPIHLHVEREVCNSVYHFLSIQTPVK